MEEPLSDNDIKWFAIEQRHKTFRILGIGVLFLIGLWMILYYAARMLDKPPWLAALIAIIGAVSAQTPFFVVVVRFVTIWTKTHIARHSRREKEEDPGRTSSGLLEDGRDPPEEGS